MTPKPHDVVDLRLAPVALQLDQRLDELGRLSLDDLHYRVELESNRPVPTQRMREQELLTSITRLIDLGGWEVSWDPRGLRMSHGTHSVVLGAPPNLREFVSAGRPEAPAGVAG